MTIRTNVSRAGSRLLLASLLLAGFSVSACKKDKKSDAPTNTAANTPTADCMAVAARATSSLVRDIGEEAKVKVAPVLEKLTVRINARCTEDAWSDELRTCLVTAATDTELEKCPMSDEQEAKMMAELDALAPEIQAAMGDQPGMAPAPAPTTAPTN